MNEWVIAEWIEEGATIREPSYLSPAGVWYRAGTSDVGGPTILRMDHEPREITRIQGASPQRESEFAALRATCTRQEVRIANLDSKISKLEEFFVSSMNRIERHISLQTGSYYSPPPMHQPVFGPVGANGGGGSLKPADVFAEGLMRRAGEGRFVIPDLVAEAKGK
jgi:hypothetical protein